MLARPQEQKKKPKCKSPEMSGTSGWMTGPLMMMTHPGGAGGTVFSHLSSKHTEEVRDHLTHDTGSAVHTVTTTPSLKKCFFLLNFYAICIYKNPSA